MKRPNGQKSSPYFFIIVAVVFFSLSLFILRTETEPELFSEKIKRNVPVLWKHTAISPEQLEMLKDLENEKLHNFMALENEELKQYIEEQKLKEEVLFPQIISKNSINLVYQYYQSANKAKQKELDFVLRKNIENPAIDFIHLLLESASTYPKELIESMPDFMTARIITTITSQRLTFAVAMEYAQKRLADSFVILCNADIYFDDTLLYLRSAPDMMKKHKLFALSRYNLRVNGTIDGHHCSPQYIGSHDTYIYMAPAPNYPDLLLQHDIPIGGFWGVENRALYELSSSGFSISNPCYILKSYHLHVSNYRNIPEERLNLEKSKMFPPVKKL